MHEVLVNRLGGLSLPRKSVVRLTDRPDMTLDVYRGRKTTMQQQQIVHILSPVTRKNESIWPDHFELNCELWVRDSVIKRTSAKSLTPFFL